MTARPSGPAVVAERSAPARVRFNPFGADFRRDPYADYRRLREARPVHRTLGMWVLTRHADVMSVMRDRSFSVGLIPQLVTQQVQRVAPDDRARVNVDRIGTLGRKSLVFTDNPDHARLRPLVNRAFTTAVAGLRPRIEQIVDELLEDAWRRGEMDGVADFAGPLPIRVMCDWMALPDDLHDRVGPWTHDLRGLLEPGLLRADELTHVSDVLDAFVDAIAGVVDERRTHPGEDLVSELIATQTSRGDRLSAEELVFVCIMCFVAGNETTKSLIGNGLLALLQHPSEDDRLRRDPGLVDGAVAEALRYDCPLQMTKRVATRDVRIGEEVVREGDQVLLCMGAANRDPEVFDRPEEFDITRAASPHVAYGYGMHGCLGARLATLQAQVAFERLYRRPERLELADEPLEWQRHSFIVRGLKALPVAVRGAAA
jgi:cytochrome P450